MSKIILFTLFLFISCTTIELKEEEAFDVKRSIEPDYFTGSDYTIEEIEFSSGDTLLLNGWRITQDSSIGTVLYFGGNGFVMVTSFYIINSIIEQNVDLMIFDYRGYGKNPGKPTVAGLREDGLAAYDFLTGDGGANAESLILHGHSLGSFVASYVADKRGAAGLVLESPVTDIRDWTGRLVPWLLKPFIRFDIDPVLRENSNIERLSGLDIPLLIVTGRSDQITPPGMAEKLYDKAASGDKELLIIENGGHNDLPQRQEYKDALRRFYQEVLK
jgi:hypothetical protein